MYVTFSSKFVRRLAATPMSKWKKASAVSFVFQRPDAFCVSVAEGENFHVKASPAPNAPLDVAS